MIKTLMKSVREYKRSTILTPVFMIFEVAMECLLPLYMAKLIDNMKLNSSGLILRYGLILFGMAIVSLISGVLSGRNAAIASCGFAKNLRHDIYYSIQDLSFSDIDKFSTSSLITRMTSDVTNVQIAFQMIIRMAVRSPLMLIFSVIMSFRINVDMALIFLAIIPVLAIALFLIGHTNLPVFRRIFKKYDALNATVQENISGIRVVKSFVREDFEINKFKMASESVKKDFTKAEKSLALLQPIMIFSVYLAMLLVSYFGSVIIIKTNEVSMTAGQLSSLITYGIQILMSMMMLSMVFVMCSISIESARRITEVIDSKSTMVSPKNGIKKVENGSIDFNNVNFRYSGQSGKNALQNINLHIDSGQFVGIIGGTGSSKTTLIQLISRLYDVSDGSVKVGGVDVREYDLNSLREQVSVVLQKNVLFSGTVKDNIRYGKKDATDAEIETVCKIAQADDFIQKFPEKYDTLIERGGTNVSGGQKQRLCIARAIIKKPKILILDDSTSAVDTLTEAKIMKSLSETMPDVTKLIIAQRVSSVQKAELILVMDDGEIVEYGTHEELMEKKGIYSEVYYSQNKGSVQEITV